MIKNSEGKHWYGIHFYPGVAEYQDSPDQEPYRVFLNEDTLRKMDSTFKIKPVFVQHVDYVDQNINELRKEADGWVIRSFFNEADGKHWVEFLTLTDEAERAIKNGWKLSNAYLPTKFNAGGLWNGVSYAKEVLDGEYEHLAIVQNPRYEESVIMTPDEFKKYNESQILELQRLANSKGEKKMKLSFFKRSKVENAIDPELLVVLPKSNREISITTLINEMDEKEVDKNSGLADMSHKVKMDDGSYCNVGELMTKHKAVCDELEAMKSKKMDEKEEELDVTEEEDDVDSESVKKENVDEKHPEDVVHDEGDKESKLKMDAEDDEEKEMKEAKKKNALEKARRLKNAHLKKIENEEAPVIELSIDRVIRGKARYGSN